ncbi:hypothetical protein HanIR_Chr14g0677681 [Helianthus annuus]|nr:hypothetical protein HanIR_Chr14g0677681 [Helianthus annuus]
MFSSLLLNFETEVLNFKSLLSLSITCSFKSLLSEWAVLPKDSVFEFPLRWYSEGERAENQRYVKRW